MLGLYTFVFGVVYRVRFQVDGVGFVPFVFCGLWPWMAFQEACLRSVTVIVENAQLMKRVQFPSELLVVSAVLSSFLSHAVGFGLMLLGVALWQGGVSLVALGLLLVPFSLQLLLAVALGLLLSPANVFLRDVSQLVTALFTVWFFCLRSCIRSRWSRKPSSPSWPGSRGSHPASLPRADSDSRAGRLELGPLPSRSVSGIAGRGPAALCQWKGLFCRLSLVVIFLAGCG